MKKIRKKDSKDYLVNNMEKKFMVAPSILSADLLNLGDEIQKMMDVGVKYIHFDVMDGHFVPNISFGIPVLKSLGHKFNQINDVHLMISEPDRYVEEFIKAGGDIITFHFEALKDDKEVAKTIGHICGLGAKCGISIKPNTPVEAIKKFLPFVDLVLVMSVEPGFGGQSFMENSLPKIKELDLIRKEMNYGYIIEVDGGINDKTAPLVKEAGVDLLVSGSYLFKASNLKEAYEDLIK